jgi:hypothetical protein
MAAVQDRPYAIIGNGISPRHRDEICDLGAAAPSQSESPDPTCLSARKMAIYTSVDVSDRSAQQCQPRTARQNEPKVS